MVNYGNVQQSKVVQVDREVVLLEIVEAAISSVKDAFVGMRLGQETENLMENKDAIVDQLRKLSFNSFLGDGSAVYEAIDNVDKIGFKSYLTQKICALHCEKYEAEKAELENLNKGAGDDNFLGNCGPVLYESSYKIKSSSNFTAGDPRRRVYWDPDNNRFVHTLAFVKSPNAAVDNANSLMKQSAECGQSMRTRVSYDIFPDSSMSRSDIYICFLKAFSEISKKKNTEPEELYTFIKTLCVDNHVSIPDIIRKIDRCDSTKIQFRIIAGLNADQLPSFLTELSNQYKNFSPIRAMVESEKAEVCLAHLMLSPLRSAALMLSAGVDNVPTDIKEDNYVMHYGSGPPPDNKSMWRCKRIDHEGSIREDDIQANLTFEFAANNNDHSATGEYLLDVNCLNQTTRTIIRGFVQSITKNISQEQFKQDFSVEYKAEFDLDLPGHEANTNEQLKLRSTAIKKILSALAEGTPKGVMLREKYEIHDQDVMVLEKFCTLYTLAEANDFDDSEKLEEDGEARSVKDICQELKEDCKDFIYKSRQLDALDSMFEKFLIEYKLCVDDPS